ncbi:MAG: hypothetical protein Q7T55_16170, partial [Solirubrobacteraceae bacterium]|nr:hypothetical protein [Solirubrobacteraceae bacterium]
GLPALLESTGTEHDLVARWRGICHSVRGALAAVGALALCEQVNALEHELRALRSRASFIAHARRLHEALIEFVQRVTRELAAP